MKSELWYNHIENMKILTKKKLDEIGNLSFPKSGFDKFDNPKNPLYHLYHDREIEKWHDTGYNNAIENVLRIIYR